MNENILLPNYARTAAIDANLERTERAAWTIERVSLPAKQFVWFQRDVSVRRAAATTAIEGAHLNEAQVRELFDAHKQAKLTDDELVNINAASAYEFVDFLSDQEEVALDELAIWELHRKFLAGTNDLHTPGYYRKGQNLVGIYTPPDQGDVPELMRAFANWLRTDNGEINPLLRAGIAHLELVAVHPFWDGNGRVSRALATLVLQRSRFRFKNLLSLERYMYAVRDESYIPAIERTLGERYARGYDATPWLEFFTTALRVEAERLADELVEWNQAVVRLQEKFDAMRLNRRKSEGLIYAFRSGRISRPGYIEVTGATPGTASRDLAELSELGLLIPQGETKGRVYTFNRDALGPDWLERQS